MMKRPSFALAALAAVTLPSLAQASEGGLPQLDPEWFASQIFWLAVHFAVLYVVAATLILPRIAQALDRRETKLAGDLETADKLGKEASILKTAHEASLSSARTEAQAARAATMAATLADQVAAEKKLGEELARQALAAQERINQASAAMRARMRDVAAEATMDIVTRLSGVAVDRPTADAALGRLLDSQLKEVA
jgi:F-type H+-transporting ATPase subunit b